MKQVPDSLLAFQNMFPDVVKLRNLTPQSLAFSIGYSANRRRTPAPNNTQGSGVSSVRPLVPEGRLAKLMADVFDGSVAAATLTAI